MSELDSDGLDGVPSIDAFVARLNGLCTRSGLSLRRLERRARALDLPRWLPSSTVSDVFRRPELLAGMPDRREFVESILRCCDVTEPAPWLATLDRLTTPPEPLPQTASDTALPAPAPAPPGPTSLPAATAPPPGSALSPGAVPPPSAGRAGRSRRVVRAAIAGAALMAVAVGVTAAVWPSGAGSRPRSAGAVPQAPACGARPANLIDASTLVGESAKRENPTLDFGYMHGSAWYETRDGATYYWGRGSSETGTGGVRLDWRIGGGPWHPCPAPIIGPGTRDRHVRTPAIRKVVDGTDVVVRVCLWADYPQHDEKCTRPL
ncbi:hypothetical protein [Actinomadura fibrosa]|uniref:XRE family transcriptional regulator n=1 Tax=Actinomadura fibrosa TaxID=111802 RepID=A0ABW2Y2U6_9ACTN|nr:hypothetical protein [Actinomadura fibrosa]